MAREIERKFLVQGDGWRKAVAYSKQIRQAYLKRDGRVAVRVRTVGDDTAFLTIKSAVPGMSRDEFEYPIPIADARALLALRDGMLIEKTRHVVPVGDLEWEIDEFDGAHLGLVIAEIELRDETDSFERPDWLGEEVTHDKRYYNAALAAEGADHAAAR